MYMGETFSRSAVSKRIKKLGHRYGTAAYYEAMRKLYVPVGDGTYFEKGQEPTMPQTSQQPSNSGGERYDVV